MSNTKGWSFDLETGEAPWGRNAYVVNDGEGAPRAAFLVRGDAERYVRDRNQEDGVATKVGDAHGEIEGNMRSRLADLAMLVNIAAGKGSRTERASMDIDTEDAEGAREGAEERLREYPLCVEATTTFEVVLGTGGPDDRLLFECSAVEPGPHDGHGGSWEINRVLYRYSWTGSAERVLSGDDQVVAEELAHQVIPELA